MIIQALILMTFVAGSFCQIIVLNNSELISPCINKSRAGKDTLVLTGTIGGNITSLLAQKWQPVVYMVLRRQRSVHHGTVCTFRIDGDTCASYPLYLCTCVYSPSEVDFAINITLAVDDSQAVLYGVWQNDNVTTIYSNNHTLPEVCGLTTASTVAPATDVATTLTMHPTTDVVTEQTTAPDEDLPESEKITTIYIVMYSTMALIAVGVISAFIAQYINVKMKRSQVNSYGCDVTTTRQTSKSWARHAANRHQSEKAHSMASTSPVDKIIKWQTGSMR